MEEQNAAGPKQGNFLSAGFRELGRKMGRSRLRGAMRKQDAERAVALVALGQRAWDEKLDLSSFAELRDRLAGLDARAGELSATSGKLESDKTALDTERRTELEIFSTRRKAVEEKKSPVDTSLRAARSTKSATEQAIRQFESQLATIAGKLSAFDRVIVSLGTATEPEQAAKLAKAQADRSKLVMEQGDFNAKLTKARGDLPAQVADESRLASESQKFAAEIAVIDAEQKASIAHIDENLTRVRKELQGTSQQASAVQKDRSGNLGSLGQALYDAKLAAPQLAEPVERVAAIDRERAQTQASLDVSLAETQLLPGATMAKFWSVLIGVPLLLAALGVGGYKFMHRQAAPAPMAKSVAAKSGQGCESRQAPDQGEGVAIYSDCTRMEGTFVEGRLHGKGKKVWATGEAMEGRFFSGVLYGPGVRVYRDGRRVEATFANGRPVGPGKITMADGTVYQGNLWGQTILGWGVRRSPDGVIVAGDWRDASEGVMRPIGEMLRVLPGGAREKVDASVIDPAVPKPSPSTAAATPNSKDY